MTSLRKPFSDATQFQDKESSLMPLKSYVLAAKKWCLIIALLDFLELQLALYIYSATCNIHH